MILPESERPVAIKKAREILDAGGEIVAEGPHGVVVRDKAGNTIAITPGFVDVILVDEIVKK